MRPRARRLREVLHGEPRQVALHFVLGLVKDDVTHDSMTAPWYQQLRLIRSHSSSPR
jgi:hypothetical protein